MATELKISWTIYPIAWDSVEESYTNDAVRMSTRLHFSGLEFSSYADALEAGTGRTDSFIVSAELPYEVAVALVEHGKALWPDFMAANGIPEELQERLIEYLDPFEREFSQTVLL